MAIEDLESAVATAQGELMALIDKAEPLYTDFAGSKGSFFEGFDKLCKLFMSVGEIIKAKLRYDRARLELGVARDTAHIHAREAVH